MGVNLSQVDVSNVEERQALDAIPNGWYNTQIVGSEMKPTSKGNGSYLEFQIEVLDGPHKGRKVYDRLNLDNPNQTTVEIAFQTLKSIYSACGKVKVNDSAELHGIPFVTKVSIEAAGTGADGKEYDASNRVAGYDKAGSDHKIAAGAPATGSSGGPPTWAQGNAASTSAPAQQATPAQTAQQFEQPAAQQPWSQPPAPPAAPSAALVPTDKAGDISYGDFIANGWTDEHLVAEGYFTQAIPPTPPGPPAAPVAPSSPPAAPASTPAGQAVPVWARK